MVGCYIAILDSQRFNEAIPQGNTWCPVPVGPWEVEAAQYGHRLPVRPAMSWSGRCCMSWSETPLWGHNHPTPNSWDEVIWDASNSNSWLLYFWKELIYKAPTVPYHTLKPSATARGHLEGCQLFPHVRQHPQDCFTFWSRGQTSQRKNAPVAMTLWLRTVHTRWWYTV